ncbi:glycosyltransferase family 4 protein [Parvularcula dongshanensis]|uniref:Glycosyltransferase involved in cell wall biosynthesis n=1 Tax=Parvularcula dongshanensis TaxID=1173995 RepID=A0A840I7H3_9PROT|nr:glycosyltransferase family 4 protein [Parvularcula dongshanensis]MBB4659910.1 glycosyltransferase involved in cell wall biosynthesis [Parvularcula dongshanensis]
MKVLLFAPNASERMGGEAVLPLHYLREFEAMGLRVSLLTHARCRAELTSGPYARYDLHFIEDSPAEKAIWRSTKGLPSPVRSAGGIATGTLTDYRLGAAARRLAERSGCDLIHQVTPVSPRAPSFVTGTGLPLVIGPMNGNMSYPAGFEAGWGEGTGKVVGAARALSDGLNAAFPGKTNAARLLVANERTRRGLPAGIADAKVVTLVENGVDLSLWQAPEPLAETQRDLVFVGRLVKWKAVDILIDAVASVPEVRLRIVGDGAQRAALEAQTKSLGLSDRVLFEGFQPKERVRSMISDSRALVLPSVYECGGAVVLEAMACARPVVATDWGGPADYLEDGATGFLVAPSSPEGLRDGLAEAIRKLGDTERACAMGLAGRRRVEADFSWKAKAEFVRGVYEDVLAERSGVRPAA